MLKLLTVPTVAAAFALVATPAGAKPVTGVKLKAPVTLSGAKVGTALPVAVTLTNKLATKSAKGNLHVYLSADKTKSRGALIGTAAVKGIKAHKHRTVSVTTLIPASVAPGSYRVLAVLDKASTKCTLKKPCTRTGAKTAATLTVVSAAGGPTVAAPAPAPTPGPAAAAPTAVNDSYADPLRVSQCYPTTITAANGVLANDTDPAGHALTAALVTGPADGSVALQADGSFVYSPPVPFNPGHVVTETFTYTASDGTATSSAATVSLTLAQCA
jgi:hypothetical protein